MGTLTKPLSLKDQVSFQCRLCGDCCRGLEGQLMLEPPDAYRLGPVSYTHLVAKLGVEALELKIKGYSGADIARLYHTKPNHVGAWIARAAEKFRQDAISADLLSQMGFEKGA